MKVCVVGLGAIGGHLAARLAKGGAEVSALARGAQRDGVRAAGRRRSSRPTRAGTPPSPRPTTRPNSGRKTR